MVCWFIHGLNQIKSCQQAFEVSGKLVRWATNVNIKIPTDQDLIIFWENVSQKLRELMNKALIIYRRVIDNCTQHRTCELYLKQLQFKREVCTYGKKPTFKNGIEHSSKSTSSPRHSRGTEEKTTGWKELRERTVITWFKPGFSQQEEIQGMQSKKSHLG